MGATSHNACDRAPMASAAASAPLKSRQSSRGAGVRADAVIVDRCSTHAATSSACAASARANPGTSLIGRAAVNQNNGAVTARTAVRSARPSRPIRASAGSPRPSSRRNSTKSGMTAMAPASALTSASARASVPLPGGAPKRATTGRASIPRPMITG